MMPRLAFSVLLALLIAGCAAGDQPTSPESRPSEHSREPQAVLDITWQWESTITPVETVTVPNPERYTIFLKDNGKAQMQFDCNGGGGDYQISTGKLAFGPLMSTRMACPPDSMDGPFMRDLQRVSSFFVDDGKLYLELPMDSGTMRFRPAR
jgi:heat shock protein HslJ